jgi:co-chaperonin GroES (HSP10)
MKPLRDIILIKPDGVAEKTTSGLYIKEDWKTLPLTGEIVAVGDAVTAVKAGDKVIFDRFGAINYLDKDLKMCTEKQIYGVINENNQAN